MGAIMEYVLLISILLYLFSLKYKYLFVITPFVYFFSAFLLKYNSDLLSLIYIFKGELFMSLMLLFSLILFFSKLDYSFPRIVFCNIILVVSLFYENVFVSLILLEFFRFVVFSQKTEVVFPREVAGLAIKSFFLYVLLRHGGIYTANWYELSYLVPALNEVIVFFSLIYFFYKILEIISSVSNNASGLNVIYPFFVLLILLEGIASSFEFYSNHTFTIINNLSFEFILTLVLTTLLFKLRDVKITLLIFGSMFCGSILYFDTMSFVYFSIPILLYVIDYKNIPNDLKIFRTYNDQILPLSFSFMLIVIPILMGNEFVQSVMMAIGILMVITFLIMKEDENKRFIND